MTEKHLTISDWDDTITPTTELLGKCSSEHLASIDEEGAKFIRLCLEIGSIDIVTNASKEWVPYSSNKWFPKIHAAMKNISVYSAADKYRRIIPESTYSDVGLVYAEWKFRTMVELVERSRPTHVTAFGDSDWDRLAILWVKEVYPHIVVKSVKLIEKPSSYTHLCQLKALNALFNTIRDEDTYDDIQTESLTENIVPPVISTDAIIVPPVTPNKSRSPSPSVFNKFTISRNMDVN